MCRKVQNEKTSTIEIIYFETTLAKISSQKDEDVTYNQSNTQAKKDRPKTLEKMKMTLLNNVEDRQVKIESNSLSYFKK